MQPYRTIDMLFVLLSLFSGFIISLTYLVLKLLFNFGSISQSLGIQTELLEVIFEYIIAAIVIITIYIFILKKYQQDWHHFGFKKLPLIKTISYILISFIFTFSTWIIVAIMIFLFFPDIDLAQKQSIFQDNMPELTQILMIIYAVIIGPFIEEIVFRGVVLPVLARKFNIIIGIIFSTLIWSLLHFQINVIIFTFIFGLILSYTYVKSKSLWPAYLTHVLKNLIAVLALYFLGLN